MMTSREEIIKFCLTFSHAYEDYPFDDFNWTVMRRKDTHRGFAWIFEREGEMWVNIKVDPDWGEFWREVYPSVNPAYHMNKKHWNSVILDGTVPEEELCRMIASSYELCGKKQRRPDSETKGEQI